MDLQKTLIECGKQKGRGGWKASAASVAAHAALLSTVIFFTATATDKAEAEDKPIGAFITRGAAPPPPPPPPAAPPPASSNVAPQQQRPKVMAKVEPQPVRLDRLQTPTQIPREVPKVEPTATQTQAVEELPASMLSSGADVEPQAVEGGVPGGVAGGIAGGEVGGVVGGEVGGVKGGEIGGVIGGEVGGVKGGVLGGEVGGTGSGDQGNGTGGNEAPVVEVPKPEVPSGPMRVGGDVKAPVAVRKVDPEYTDLARTARIAGVVVLEAVIDKQGNVDRVKVLKGLPMGLDEAAKRAVREWKFKPGTMNGQPVDVIFSLTINFKLDN